MHTWGTFCTFLIRQIITIDFITLQSCYSIDDCLTEQRGPFSVARGLLTETYKQESWDPAEWLVEWPVLALAKATCCLHRKWISIGSSELHSLLAKDRRQFLYVKRFQKFSPTASLALISLSKMLTPQSVETVPDQGHPSRLYICSCVEIARQWIFQFKLNFIISIALIGRISYRLKSLGFIICFCNENLLTLNMPSI